MRPILSIFAVAALTLSILPASAAADLPRSREATLVESTSPTELLIRAKGIGYWEKGMSKKRDIDKTLNRSAEEDGRKAAVWFVLYGGTDPLLSTDEARLKFTPFQDDFFTPDNIRNFIAWEGDEFLSRVKKEIERKKRYELHIEKTYKVNKGAVTDWLVAKGVIPAPEAVTEALGMPFILVIPAVKQGESPVAKLKSNPNLSHAARVIEGYLTARRYEVIVPEQQQDLSRLAAAQLSLEGAPDDYSYQLALSVGADVYITYEVSLESDRFDTRKAVVNVRAFEATTARLLGAETGYSPAAQASEKALIESAVNDAVDKVLSRVMEYWKSDLGKGVQYKVVVTIAPSFEEEFKEEIVFLMLDVMKMVAKDGRYKENIVADKTLDYIVWCDPAGYGSASLVYRRMKQVFDDNFQFGVLKRISLNRKLILVEVAEN